jgi:prefoldin subunit 5
MIGGKIELNEINQSIDKIRGEIKALRNLVDQFNKEQAEEAVKQTSFSFYDSVKNENISLGSPSFEISIENAVKQLIKKRDQLKKNDDTKYRENINKLNNTIKQIYKATSENEIINLLKNPPTGVWKNSGLKGGMKTKRKRKAKKYSHKK